MMFPASFFDPKPSFGEDFINECETQAELVTPGKVYRDCLAFGTSPDGVQGSLYDDDDNNLIDAACDLTVQKTDLIDKAFYPDNPEYQTPASLKKKEAAPSVPTPIAPPAGDSAGDSDSVQSSAVSAE